MKQYGPIRLYHLNNFKCRRITIIECLLFAFSVLIMYIYYMYGPEEMPSYKVKEVVPGHTKVTRDKKNIDKKGIDYPKESFQSNFSIVIEKRKKSKISEKMTYLRWKAQLLQQSIWNLRDAINKTVHMKKKTLQHKELASLLLKFNNCLNTLEKLHSERSKKNLQLLKELQKVVENCIAKLQNPHNCAKNLVCSMNSRSGMGSEMHLVAECVFAALGTGRNLFIESSQAFYKSMHYVFEAMTHYQCPFPSLTGSVKWEGELSPNDNYSQYTTVTLSTWFSDRPKTKFFAATIPKSILDQLQDIHEDPGAWWTGQIMKYLIKVRPVFADQIERMKKDVGFTHPIVGVHVRRTDKITSGEAQYFDLSEYMRHVKDWYDRYDMRNGGSSTRRVFLATDVAPLTVEAKKRYPDYTFIHNTYQATNIFYALRYSHKALVAELADVTMLTKCDYFVGTFSSNVGRLVYELMQADADRTMDVVSLDQVYHYHIHPEWAVAVMEHTRRHEGEISLTVGDRILLDITTSTQNFGFGKNYKTGDIGKFPMVKVNRRPLTAPYIGF